MAATSASGPLDAEHIVARDGRRASGGTRLPRLYEPNMTAGVWPTLRFHLAQGPVRQGGHVESDGRGRNG
eukprot:8986064-Alexandrium_andersonii.AAC.1